MCRHRASVAIFVPHASQPASRWLRLKGLRRGQSAQRIEIDRLYSSLNAGEPRDGLPPPSDPDRLATFCAIDKFAQVRLRFGNSDLIHVGGLMTIHLVIYSPEYPCR